jgi:hypothetical protein
MKSNSELITLLHECAKICDHCCAECLKEYEVMDLANCIRIDMVCGSVCRTTALLLENGFADKTAFELCERICRRCAEECNEHEHDHCKECAKICTECADECRKMQ